HRGDTGTVAPVVMLDVGVQGTAWPQPQGAGLRERVARFSRAVGRRVRRGVAVRLVAEHAGRLAAEIGRNQLVAERARLADPRGGQVRLGTAAIVAAEI